MELLSGALFAARRGCFTVGAEIAADAATSFTAAAVGVAASFAIRRDFTF